MPSETALALVPARMGSKGVPGKNLRRIGGVSLTTLAVRCAWAAGLFERVVVSTDGGEIAVEGRSAGADTIVRPAELASDEADVADVITHALDVLAGEHGFAPAVVALLEPSSPLRTPDMVRAAVAALDAADAVFTVSEAPRRFHWLKQFHVDEDGYAHRVLRDVPMPVRRQELGPSFVQNGAVYVFRTSMFRVHHSVFGPKPRALVVTTPLVNIDTLEDLAEAERLLRDRGHDGS
ncbi:MAG: acylneuraminate cytidylyltransferase family protein [Candidatus Rokuibacteriota bacterium]|nr:MAG: acylneuraminate cytidylyltransferase family protein [Candidatus Rokubacteria bacterium]